MPLDHFGNGPKTRIVIDLKLYQCLVIDDISPDWFGILHSWP